MSTLYSVLGVAETASREDIKRCYRERALSAHPDKGGSPGDFVAVQRAWETLKHEERRREYDAVLARERLLERSERHVTELVRADDMCWDEQLRALRKTCRCGGHYSVTDHDVEQGVDIVECSRCSFRIRVIFGDDG